MGNRFNIPIEGTRIKHYGAGFTQAVRQILPHSPIETTVNDPAFFEALPRGRTSRRLPQHPMGANAQKA
jgi:hypothetical protein